MARRRRRTEGVAPMTSAGLVRFFEEEIQGLKVRPEIVIFSAFALIILVIMAHMLLRIPLP